MNSEKVEEFNTFIHEKDSEGVQGLIMNLDRSWLNRLLNTQGESVYY